MATIVGTAVEVMLHTGDLAPAARTMGTAALAQWATLYGVAEPDDVDMMYIIGVAYARGTVARDGEGDFPLSGEWAGDPTPQDVRDIAAALYGVNAWDADASVDAWENGYYDERNQMHGDARTMADVLEVLTASRQGWTGWTL